MIKIEHTFSSSYPNSHARILGWITPELIRQKKIEFVIRIVCEALLFASVVTALLMLSGCEPSRAAIELEREKGRSEGRQMALETCETRVEQAENKGWEQGKKDMKAHYEAVVSSAGAREVVLWVNEIKALKGVERPNKYWVDLADQARKMTKPLTLESKCRHDWYSWGFVAEEMQGHFYVNRCRKCGAECCLRPQ